MKRYIYSLALVSMLSASAAMQELTSMAQYTALIAQTPFVVLDFYADWCGPCKDMSNIISQLANEFQHVTVMKIDVQKFPEIARQFGITSIPFFVFIKNGQVAGTKQGRCSKNELRGMLKNYFA